MLRRSLFWAGTAALAVSLLTPALARPNYLATFKAHYKTADGKTTLNAANCSLCHVGAPNQGNFNAYGQAVRAALAGKTRASNADIEKAIVEAESKRAGNAGQTFGRRIAGDRLPAAPGGGNQGNGGNAGAAGDAGNAAAVVPTGPWENLVNGKDLSNFTVKNDSIWEVKDGHLFYGGKGNGWLSTNKQYKNYAAVIVWREPGQHEKTDAGVFLKTTGVGSPFPEGPQLNMGPGQSFGSIGGLRGTRNRFDLIHPGGWNEYQITVQNGTVTLAINGQPAWDYAEGLPDRPGYIGLQSEGYPVEIAAFWVQPLP